VEVSLDLISDSEGVKRVYFMDSHSNVWIGLVLYFYRSGKLSLRMGFTLKTSDRAVDSSRYQIQHGQYLHIKT
jgi:hypothetical protein